MPTYSTPSTLPPPDPPDGSLHAMLERIAQVQPEGCALSSGRTPQPPATSLSACAIRSAGPAKPGRGATVADRHGIGARPPGSVAGSEPSGQLVLLFALARLGATLVPLNHRLSIAEWQAVLADCSPNLLLHDTHLAPAAQALGEATAIPFAPVSGHRHQTGRATAYR